MNSHTAAVFIASPPAGRKRKFHVLPTEEILHVHLKTNLGQLPQPTRFLEYFYDTPVFALLRAGCWLRQRRRLDSQKSDVWCFQAHDKEMSSEHHEGGTCHIFAETTVDNKMMDQCLAKRLDGCNTTSCSNLLASYLTYRYQLTDSLYLDHCYFDIDGERTYSVLTYVLADGEELSGHSIFPQQTFMPAPTKVMEYLRYQSPSLFRKAGGIDLQMPTPEFTNKTLAEQEKPSVEVLEQIDPRLVEVRKEQKAYQEKLAELKDARLPTLLQKREYIGKYAVFFDTDDSLFIAPTFREAVDHALEELPRKAPGTHHFVVHITPESLRARYHDGNVLLHLSSDPRSKK